MSIRTEQSPPVRLPPSYRIWVSGALASQLGDIVFYFALAWSATAYGGVVAGLVLTMINLPRVGLLLIGGVAGDRFGPRRIMIVGDAVMLAVTVILAVSTELLGTPAALLLAMGFVMGTVDAFYLPAAGAMPRHLVGRELLPQALALRQTGAQVMTLAGGPLGGLLVVSVGLAGAAVFDSVTFGLALIVLIAIANADLPEAKTPPARHSVLREARDGLHVVVTDSVLRISLGLTAVAAGFLLPVASLLIPLLARQHRWPAASAGLILGAQSLGILAVALAVVRFGRMPKPGLMAAAGLLIASVGILGLAASPNVIFAAVSALLLGLGSGSFTTHLGPLLLGSAPYDYLSRVQALLALVQSVSLLVMNNVLGNAAQLAGPVAALGMSAAVVGVTALLGLSSTSIRHAGMPHA